MAKAKLSIEIKTFIVHALASFDSPSVVAASVKREFGLDISRQLVESHDPTKKAAANIPEKWKVMFEATRAAFIEDTSAIPISHRAVRLRTLQRLADKAEDRGNSVLVSSLLKQAAEEVGGAYTNRRELTGKGGAAIEVRTLADFYGGISAASDDKADT